MGVLETQTESSTSWGLQPRWCCIFSQALEPLTTRTTFFRTAPGLLPGP